MNDLGEQKRLLLLESNLHRTLIRAECAAVSSEFGNVKSKFGVFRNVSALFGIVNPTSIGTASGRAGSIAGWAALGISAWKLWRSFNALRGKSKK